jgi:hypothetical protein
LFPPHVLVVVALTAGSSSILWHHHLR